MVTAPTVQGAKNGNGDKKAMAVIPFTRAAREKKKQAFQLVATLGASPLTLNPIQLPPGGFLKYVDISVACVTAGNAAAVTFAADGPFNVLTYVDLRNSAGDSIIVPFTGYQLMLINKYGALGVDPPYADPRTPRSFSTTAGAGATGGSFTFFVRIPLEFDPRDAIGSLPNLAANKSYQLQLNLSASTVPYGTPPTNAGTVTITGVMSYWSQPNQLNVANASQQVAPLGNGTVSLWRLQNETVAAGEKLTQLLNVGNVIRCIIFVLRTAAGARTTADWAAISQLILNDDIVDYMPTAFWNKWMGEDYGYDVAGPDAYRSLDTGVFVYSEMFNQRGAVLADGPRDQFLVTYNTTLLQLRSTSFGASASSLEIIQNDVKPTSPLALYSPNIV